jgi:hypothetical protein
MPTQFQTAPPINQYTERDWQILWYTVDGHVGPEGWTQEENDHLIDIGGLEYLSMSREEWREANGFVDANNLVVDRDEDEEERSGWMTRSQALKFFSWNLGYTRNQLIRLNWFCSDGRTPRDREVCKTYWRNHPQPRDDEFRWNTPLGNHYSRKEALTIRNGEDDSVVWFDPDIVLDYRGRFGAVSKDSKIKRAKEVIGLYESRNLGQHNLRGIIKILLGDLFVYTKTKVDLNQVYFETLEAYRLEEQREKEAAQRSAPTGVTVTRANEEVVTFTRLETTMERLARIGRLNDAAHPPAQPGARLPLPEPGQWVSSLDDEDGPEEDEEENFDEDGEELPETIEEADYDEDEAQSGG